MVALVCIGLYFLEHRAAIRQAAAEVDAQTILAAMAAIIIGLLPGAWAWQRLCARRLHGVTTLHGILVYLRSAVGKYTPGGVLTFVVQQRLLGRHGSSPAMLVQTFVGAALAGCLSAGMLGLPAAFALAEDGTDERWILAGSLLLLLVLVFALRARRWPIVTKIWTNVGMPPPLPFAQATVLLAGASGLTGVHLAVLGRHTGGGALFLVSAYALSTIFGLVFAVLPGAVGVRDGALLFILATRLAPADAAMLALLSRALIVAGDVIGAALSALALRLTPSTLHFGRDTT
ncbi:hypothetical protein [Krasilnikovia sp. MM14-A1259]|uniref:hypothetical protein n=1 Tax=Krasilnikovia sp. MM14-A1259 TaxID=3373539 RepID=UPI00399CF44C